MSTETVNQAADKVVPTEKEKVVFTADQQAKVEELIREANGRATRPHKDAADKLKNELETSKAALASLADELAGLKTKPDASAGQREEIDRVKTDYEKQLTHLKEVAAQGKSEADKHRAEFESLRRTQAINSAVGDIGFYKPEQISALTESRVKFDAGRGKFVVFNDQGTERMNASFEPMSLKEYYQEFAAENPFLVKGTAATGAGSTHSTGLSSNGVYKVEDIFGPKSNAQKANLLARTDINEYRRLKAIAQASR